ncbi:MAG: DUF4139 domain-containing protein [Bdellovibrionales bacterium]|nr:DUF4139 domain-containing protein [Bdellovibrionales bacterium]
MTHLKRLLPLVTIYIAFAQSAAAVPISSTQQDIQQTNITVYNSGRGLVTEQRSLTLPAGEVELRYMDVPQRIMAQTVSIRALSNPDAFHVLEQNYEFDLLTPQKLLEKYVGQDVTLVFKRMQDNSTVIERKTGRLLSTNSGTVWNIDGAIAINPQYTGLEFPSVPENLIAQPTLVWLLNNKAEGKRSIEASYLTTGISWNADYVLTLDNEGKRGNLLGWVTIDNSSGATYRDARLQLIAGDVHQVSSRMDYAAKRSAVAGLAMEEAPSFEEKSFFEYHLYTLQRPATIKDNQQKQVTLLEAATIPVKRSYELTGQQWFYSQLYRSGDEKEKVSVVLQLRNDKQNNMGIPLPKGIVRVYSTDSDGSKQFVGEDQIDHTPKDETLKLHMGKAFDVVAERKQTDWRKLGSSLYESEYEIKIRNHKDEAIVVTVREPIGGDWTMLSHSHEYTKTGAFNAEFAVPVEKDGESVLTYRVRVRY